MSLKQTFILIVNLMFISNVYAIDYPIELKNKLQFALESKGSAYIPRTEHLDKQGKPLFTNRLILESSPYLIQHAHNPVNWYAWGKNAFAQAKKDNKPIFLSIGYATCHWCHVMEKESFDNLEIAKFINDNFICIKVDREQHPEIDEIYMKALLLTRGSGGWPMSNFLTPEGKPFFAGTYFPPKNFINVLKQINEFWHEKPKELIAQAETISNAVKETTNTSNQVRKIGKPIIEQTINSILERHDSLEGGFSTAPKFPQEPLLFLLLRAETRQHSDEIINALNVTLTAMAQGGIYDQIGGGFHRYSTDPQWLVPHFEKMLYNQGNLARVYLQAYKIIRNPLYARIAQQILDYILRDMTTPNGTFYAATDADSENEEGTFFLWTPAQIKNVLNENDAKLFLELYDISADGNFEGKNIPNLPVSLQEYATKNNLNFIELQTKIDKIRETLRINREKREHPFRDDKIILSWNAMVISALTQATDILDKQEQYLTAAIKNAEYIWQEYEQDGKFWRNYYQNKNIIATQEDLAYFAEALINLYDVTADNKWLKRAEIVNKIMLNDFWDVKNGGFFMSAIKDTPLITRPKDYQDNAIPAGNSVALNVLTMLAIRTGKEEYYDKANDLVKTFSTNIAENPTNHAYMLLAIDSLLHGEISTRQYAARGVVKMEVTLDKNILTVNLNIKDGWHINAHKPLQKDLIATTLTSENLFKVKYPTAELLNLSFNQKQKLALYTKNATITAEIKDKKYQKYQKYMLNFQACSNDVCLPPESLSFRIKR
jgi:uncharacterized protein YyaL (SSP411 family)